MGKVFGQLATLLIPATLEELVVFKGGGVMKSIIAKTLLLVMFSLFAIPVLGETELPTTVSFSSPNEKTKFHVKYEWCDHEGKNCEPGMSGSGLMIELGEGTEIGSYEGHPLFKIDSVTGIFHKEDGSKIKVACKVENPAGHTGNINVKFTYNLDAKTCSVAY